MSTSVICPGSFDPITLGHVDVFERALETFDEVVVAVVGNPSKAGSFPVEQRIALIEASLPDADHLEVIAFDGLLVDLCRQRGITTLLKGLRTVGDFEYEQQMAQMNRHLGGVETLFVPTAPQHTHLSSSLVREIAAAGGSVRGLVPEPVRRALEER